jgi:hypothetical protein
MLKNKKELFSIFLLISISFLSVGMIYPSLSYADKETSSLSETSNIGPRYSNVTAISDGYGDLYWNNGTSNYPSIDVGNDGVIYAAWKDFTNGSWGSDSEIMFSLYTKTSGWTYPIVVSDGFNDNSWNEDFSSHPSLKVDENGHIHLVWYDGTDGRWGTDSEIMYANYIPGEGWSNATVISDGFQGSYWNDGGSTNPEIEIGNQGRLHVVWQDGTDGPWGVDNEIMYVEYTSESGWSNATVISDGFGSSYWNDGSSQDPSVAVDGDNGIHVAWEDYTDGPWDSDSDIMYVNNIPGNGWSNATVITYGEGYRNRGRGENPSIDVDPQDVVHLVWSFHPGDPWGFDEEILYSKYTPKTGWLNFTVISDGHGGSYWNTGQSARASLDVDDQGNVYVVWDDNTIGPGISTSSDQEIMYSAYTETTGWTYPIIISDGYKDSYWNEETSWLVDLVVDNQGEVHVVWEDGSDAIWKTTEYDEEILYVSIERSNEAFPGPFTLSTNADDPDNDGIFNLKWTESVQAEKYTIYMGKNGSIEEYAVGLTDRTYRVIGLSNGTYNFEIEAINDQGKTKSNEINVTVEIPPLYQDTSTDNETQDEEFTPAIPFGNYYLGFLAIGVISIVVIVHYKQKHK